MWWLVFAFVPDATKIVPLRYRSTSTSAGHTHDSLRCEFQTCRNITGLESDLMPGQRDRHLLVAVEKETWDYSAPADETVPCLGNCQICGVFMLNSDCLPRLKSDCSR
jgi:hypothetical protein